MSQLEGYGGTCQVLEVLGGGSPVSTIYLWNALFILPSWSSGDIAVGWSKACLRLSWPCIHGRRSIRGKKWHMWVKQAAKIYPLAYKDKKIHSLNWQPSLRRKGQLSVQQEWSSQGNRLQSWCREQWNTHSHCPFSLQTQAFNPDFKVLGEREKPKTPSAQDGYTFHCYAEIPSFKSRPANFVLKRTFGGKPAPGPSQHIRHHYHQAWQTLGRDFYGTQTANITAEATGLCSKERVLAPAVNNREMSHWIIFFFQKSPTILTIG